MSYKLPAQKVYCATYPPSRVDTRLLQYIYMYRDDLYALLSPAERQVFKKLSSPNRIQDYLDHSPINFELSGESLMSPRRVLMEKKMHCMEAALFAAASLAYHGKRPLLLDLQTMAHDEDHVVTLFKENNRWGAISKTNHSILRWRDPVYKTVRELAMSYFHEYVMWKDGKKTLLTYSRPFDLRRYHPNWVVAGGDLEQIAEDLDASPHFPIAPKNILRHTRPASKIERRVLWIEEWSKDGKKNPL